MCSILHKCDGDAKFLLVREIQSLTFCLAAERQEQPQLKLNKLFSNWQQL